jgi:hypothetical protein
VDDVQPLNLTE